MKARVEKHLPRAYNFIPRKTNVGSRMASSPKVYPIRIPKYPAEKTYALKQVAALNQSAKKGPNRALVRHQNPS